MRLSGYTLFKKVSLLSLILSSLITASVFLLIFLDAGQISSIIRSLGLIRYLRGGLLGMLFALVASYLFYELTQILEGKPSESNLAFERPPSLPRQYPLLYCFQFVVSLFILIRAISELETPMDFDELGIGALLPDSTLLKIMNPFRSSTDYMISANQFVSILSSYFSTKLFGMSEIAIRLPAIGFCALFLIVLYQLCRRFASPFTTILVYLNLCVNKKFLWYTHSSKGYISMMAFTFALFSLALDFTQNRGFRHKRVGLFFSVALGTSILSHTFGGIFSCVLFLTLLLWLVFNGDELTGIALHQGVRLVLLFLGLAPLIALTFVFHGLLIKQLGKFFAGDTSGISLALSVVLGINPQGHINVPLVFLFGLIICRLWLKHDFKKDFLFLFVLVSVLFFSVSVWFLEPSFLASRFLLAFLVPFLIWAGQFVLEMSHPIPRWVTMVCLVILLNLVPLFQNSYQWRQLLPSENEFHTFVGMVKQKTKPSLGNCFSFSGEPRQSLWSERIFFASPHNLAHPKPPCKTHYLLHFEDFPFDTDHRKYPLEYPEIGNFTEILRDGKGRVLYRQTKG